MSTNYSSKNVRVVSLKKAGLESEEAQQLKQWVLGMVWERDAENGPDFWNWLEHHHQNSHQQEVLDTLLLVDNGSGKVVATVTVVEDDRDVGRRYGIKGVWAGGANVHHAHRQYNLAWVLGLALEEHVQRVADQAGSAITLNLFTGVRKVADVLVSKDFNDHGSLYVEEFKAIERWLSKTYSPRGPCRPMPPAKEESEPSVPLPSKVCLTGITAQLLFDRTTTSRDLRKGIGDVATLAPVARLNAEFDAIVYLANLGFGENEIKRAGRYDSREAYYGAIRSIQPDFLSLMLSDLAIELELNLGSELVRVNLGHAAGYSVVFPVDRAFYDGWLANCNEALAIDPSLVLASTKRGEQCYLFIEGFFHLVSLGGDIPGGAMEHLFDHLARFLPPLQWRRGRVQTCDGSPLPVVFWCANGLGQMSLTYSAGYPQVPGYHASKTMNGYHKFVINFDDLNNEGLALESPTKVAAMKTALRYVLDAQRRRGRRNSEQSLCKPIL